MSVDNLKHCPKLTYPIVKYDETNVKIGNDCDLPNWSSVTHETFISPKAENKEIGKRRKMLMEYFRIRAAKVALEQLIGDPPLPEAACFTEYIDNFCNDEFIPLMEGSEFDIKQIMKNPLYDGNIQTYYMEQFNKGNLKVTNEYRNNKRPFARKSLMTTPPELALDEPTNGF